MVSLYPNPTSGLITVSTPYKGIYSLYSITGEIIQSGEAIDTFNINMKNISDGSYFLHIKTDKGIGIKKIVLIK